MLPFKTNLYYRLKPFLPWRLRMAARRWHARRILKRCGDVWPIDPAAGRKPDGWPGWPDGKQFAFVLTHDVEGPAGLANVRALAELEMSLGFRSCFNFVPEGEYRVPPELRAWLVENGFEVGVHDLYHDGRLYRNREYFRRCAKKINGYLAEWNAVGFRPGFMLRHLDWLHDLNILYDSSTFDTDPFEPQPDGVGTIFPFWVGLGVIGDHRPQTIDHRPESVDQGPESGDHRPKTTDQRAKGGGYVELPYTLPQDSTLFLVLREKSPDIWLLKLDWVAQHGGMVLLNTHPDYVDFGSAKLGSGLYPVAYYSAFLEHVRSAFADRYWNAAPRAVAEFVRKSVLPSISEPRSSAPAAVMTRPTGNAKIWIDLDNTPHVPFFLPIISELKARGYRVVVTARDAFQVCDLAREKGLSFVKIGRHYGKNRLAKGFGLFYRALQLAPVVIREKPVLAVSHGSRSQILICNLLGVPSVLIEDYEHTLFPWPVRPTWTMVPDVIPTSVVGDKRRNVLTYPGIKEDVYAWTLQPDRSVLARLGVQNGEVVIVMRPPATEAHYHNPESERLFDAAMDYFCRRPDVRVILLPRNQKQARQIVTERPSWFAGGRVTIPDKAVDGLNLLWHADLVVSGGGTMNREAAALGVPVYSIFRGKTGAVDRYLEREGRLVMIHSADEIARKIRVVRREKGAVAKPVPGPALQCIIEHIEAAVKEGSKEARREA